MSEIILQIAFDVFSLCFLSLMSTACLAGIALIVTCIYCLATDKDE